MAGTPPVSEGCRRIYLDALLAGEHQLCAGVVAEQLRLGSSLKTVYLDLMQWAMYEVGTLWENNVVSVATEHLASATTETLLALTDAKLFSQPHKDRRAVVACVPEELHQIGTHMVASFFELHGWHSFFLGANTSAAALIRSIETRDPDVVALSMCMLFNRPQLEGTIREIGRQFPRLKILLGGRAFHGESGGRQAAEELVRRYPQLQYFDSLNELEVYLAGV